MLQVHIVTAVSTALATIPEATYEWKILLNGATKAETLKHALVQETRWRDLLFQTEIVQESRVSRTLKAFKVTKHDLSVIISSPPSLLQVTAIKLGQTVHPTSQSWEKQVRAALWNPFRNVRLKCPSESRSPCSTVVSTSGVWSVSHTASGAQVEAEVSQQKKATETRRRNHCGVILILCSHGYHTWAFREKIKIMKKKTTQVNICRKERRGQCCWVTSMRNKRRWVSGWQKSSVNHKTICPIGISRRVEFGSGWGVSEACPMLKYILSWHNLGFAALLPQNSGLYWC